MASLVAKGFVSIICLTFTLDQRITVKENKCVCVGRVYNDENTIYAKVTQILNNIDAYHSRYTKFK